MRLLGTTLSLLQRHPTPPPARGTSPSPPTVVRRNLLFTPVVDPQHVHVIMDTSVLSAIMDGYVMITYPAKFFGSFPGLRQVVDDVRTAVMVLKVERSVMAYNWYST